MEQFQERKLRSQVGPVLKSLREGCGLSQDELAEKVGCEVKSVRRWELGRGTPQPENRRRLAEALGLDVETLVTLIKTGKLQKPGAEMSMLTQTFEDQQTNKISVVPPEHNRANPNREYHLIFWYQAQLPHAQEFYGRKLEREHLKGNIQKGISTSIVGPRRIGKTWLLSYIQKGYLTITDSQLRIGFLDATQPSCATQIKFVDAALEVLEELDQQDDHPLATTLPPDQDLFRLEKGIKRLMTNDIIPLLCIDEFEGFCKHPQEFPSDFFTQLRSLTQKGLVLITASKKPLIDLVSQSGQTSPFFNIFDVLNLQGFNRIEATEFITEKSVKANFSREEQNHLLDIVQDEKERWSPARLQLAGQRFLEDKLGTNVGDRHPEDPVYWKDFGRRLEKAYLEAGS